MQLGSCPGTRCCRRMLGWGRSGVSLMFHVEHLSTMCSTHLCRRSLPRSSNGVRRAGRPALTGPFCHLRTHPDAFTRIPLRRRHTYFACTFQERCVFECSCDRHTEARCVALPATAREIMHHMPKTRTLQLICVVIGGIVKEQNQRSSVLIDTAAAWTRETRSDNVNSAPPVT